jgi:sulfonate transport system substrate-binding protein
MKTLNWKHSLCLGCALLLIPLTSLRAANGHKGSTIRFAFQDRIGSVIPIIACRKGFFKEQGLKIKPLRFSSGPACSEALYSGAADIGAMGDTTAVIMTVRSHNFVIIASHATGEHRHRLVVRKDSEIVSIKDLIGKRVGVKKGTSTYGGLLAVLKQDDIPTNEMTLIDLEPPIMTDALMAGSLDAFAASEPTPSMAEEKGAVELTTLGGLGNVYPILILAKKDFLERNPLNIQKFLQSLKKSATYVAEHPQETASIMTQEIELPLSTTKHAMARHQYDLRLDAEIFSSLKQTAQFLQGQDIIDELPDLSAPATSNLLECIPRDKL